MRKEVTEYGTVVSPQSVAFTLRFEFEKYRKRKKKSHPCIFVMNDKESQISFAHRNMQIKVSYLFNIILVIKLVLSYNKERLLVFQYIPQLLQRQISCD